MAEGLATAAVSAEQRGKRDLGVAHLLDFLDALREGRLHGEASPQVRRPRHGVLVADADRGTAQLAVERAAATLVEAARDCGVAALSVTNCFPAGELAPYATRFADAGLIALACANSPALMSVFGSASPIAGTNPLAFAIPHPRGPRVFDQAASEAAWVSVRDAARRGDPLPPGWALGPDGQPTTDARAALDGALLPFGGVKGSNIAVMIEVLAAMSGGAFSLDAEPFDAGDRSPQLGMLIVAIDPSAFAEGYEQRVETHLERLADDHGVDVGRRKHPLPEIELAEPLYRALRDL